MSPEEDLGMVRVDTKHVAWRSRNKAEEELAELRHLVVQVRRKKNVSGEQDEGLQRARLVRAEMSINGSRRPSYDGRLSTDQRPSSGLRRANTTGSRAQSMSVPSVSIPPPISGHPAPSNVPSSPNNVVDKARAKARNSFKDLVARMKN